jgi:2-polyprenyl-6-methoxyphenol hydroxylase-like FAD-dependent oxidoreductase
MEIAVVGAGIGGLIFALSAHRLGFNVKVYESVEQLRPLGVGINLQPNAVRELTALGLGERLAEIAVATAELAYFSKPGQAIGFKQLAGIDVESVNSAPHYFGVA